MEMLGMACHSLERGATRDTSLCHPLDQNSTWPGLRSLRGHVSLCRHGRTVIAQGRNGWHS